MLLLCACCMIIIIMTLVVVVVVDSSTTTKEQRRTIRFTDTRSTFMPGRHSYLVPLLCCVCCQFYTSDGGISYNHRTPRVYIHFQSFSLKMPKSKRKRKTALTKTQGKGAQLKMDLVEKIRDSVDKYKFLYVFSYENMRTNMFKKVRQELKDSRLFLGKNKVMQIALGRTEEDEYGDDLMKISNNLSGNRGLLFSNKTLKAMNKIFDNSVQQDFARAGNIATETVEFAEGPLPSMPHNMDEPLRNLGMPVMLKRGIVTLIKPFTVCQEGEPLSPEQARILKHFNYKLAEFKLTLTSYWSEGEYHSL